MIQYVVGFMFSKNRAMVALIRKTHSDWQDGLLNGIGGHRQYTETSAEAMARKFLEEAGVETKPEQWIHKLTLVNEFKRYELAVLYMVDDNDDMIHLVKTMTDEQIVVIPVAHTNNRYNRVMPNLNWLIPLCLDPHIKPGAIMQDIGEN
jgi:8-oxo-dGTP diphosphatase